MFEPRPPRSLDELPPQTRRLLMQVEELVSRESKRLSLKREDYRFSRKLVREHTRWSQTQLRVHLGRLVEMEYLTVHRGGRGQGYVYELTWDGEGLPEVLEAVSASPSWRGSAGTWRGGERHSNEQENQGESEVGGVNGKLHRPPLAKTSATVAPGPVS